MELAAEIFLVTWDYGSIGIVKVMSAFPLETPTFRGLYLQNNSLWFETWQAVQGLIWNGFFYLLQNWGEKNVWRVKLQEHKQK